jgi:ACS family sodium-dependent inorganic phosphate cotransporter
MLFFYQNSMMLYLTKVLGFPLTKGGLMASMPWFGRMAFGFFFSWAADVIKRKNIISITALRKSATIFCKELYFKTFYFKCRVVNCIILFDNIPIIHLTYQFLLSPAHLIPGICLIVVGYVGCSFLLANVFLFLALGFNGAASISNLSNNQDLSPNYAGFLYGIMNTIGCVAGMIIPPMVEAIAGRHGVSVCSVIC